jgi:YHS domain-containing protein
MPGPAIPTNSTLENETSHCRIARLPLHCVSPPRIEGLAPILRKKLPTMATATCPVCGMQIESGEAAGRLEYEGQIHYFCLHSCLDLFAANTGEYIKN